MATKKGEGTIQFFANYDRIKDLYTNKGMVVSKILYQTLKNDGLLTITYEQFNTYFKRYLIQKDDRFSTPKKEGDESASSVPVALTEERLPPKLGEEGHEPIVCEVNLSSGTAFNPHKNGIDPSRIIRKK